MAKDGAFFKSVAKIHLKYLTPHVAIAGLGITGIGILVYFFWKSRLKKGISSWPA
jgi:amino acid transporter